MKGLNAAKEILKEFEISSQNVIQPLPPIEKNVKSDDIHQYWPISSKNSITQNRVQKRTFEEKIREEIDGIVNTKNNDENQTSPRKLEPLPPFNLHISENISVGPGQTVPDPAFAYTKKDALASYKKIHKAVAPKSWTVPREEKQTSLLKELCPETEILKFGEHQDLLFEVLKHYREYLSHLDSKIGTLDDLPDPVPLTVSVREEKRRHDEAIQDGKKKQEYIAAPLPPPPKPEEIIKIEYIDPEYHELPKSIVDLGVQVQDQIDRLADLDSETSKIKPWYNKLEKTLLEEEKLLEIKLSQLREKNDLFENEEDLRELNDEFLKQY
ncbi:unnamed protein product [Oikopleura dioica]|uniref:Uncharacterized protein n=1 Tax=Oikopleura dioica TaxID=34765 RepID=E4YFZ0_OIKDI|nr:unnamed protein product [Oikopleura dioica]